MDSTAIYHHVSERYSATARGDTSIRHVQTVARAFGYSAEDLASIPAGSNLGLSCGNPLALASLKEGETVVDLGCGAGFDVFLAAKRVGESGMAVGVDMNEVCLLFEGSGVRCAEKARICSPKPGRAQRKVG
jgi:arsenite methyltransferase